LFSFFFFNDTATTEIYTLSLHDALPISSRAPASWLWTATPRRAPTSTPSTDRKSTRLNSSHVAISYAVFCLKKKMNGMKVFVVDLDAHLQPHVLLAVDVPGAGVAGHVAVQLLCFFFNDPATPEIYTLSLHDALPIYCGGAELRGQARGGPTDDGTGHAAQPPQ